ncbi:unnamed protein product [Rhizophagus irregularis]|nr:unnamed protein product [Rhizophagus irregularis]
MTNLAIAVCRGLRPTITEETPKFYAEFMKQCWDPDPSKRPNASRLPELFEEMIISPITRNIEHNTNTKTETRIFNYTASIDPIDFYEKEKASVINDDFIDVKPLPQSNIPIDSTEPVYKMQRSSIDFSNIDETIDLDSKEFSAVPTVPEGHLEEKAKSTTENVSQTTQYTAETVSSTLVNLKSKITPETTKKIVENQKPDGSIKLDKTVSDQINISSDNIQSSVQTYGVGDKISPKEHQHKKQSEKAKKCLIDELKDEKLVEKLLTTSKTSSTDTSPELKEKVAKAEKYLKTELGSEEKLKNYSIQLLSIMQQEMLRKQQSKVTTPNEKALTWLHTQIKDEKLVKEVLESCEKLVVEKASNKKKESSWPSLSTSLTGWGSSWVNILPIQLNKQPRIVENQKPDGSIKLDKPVSDQINISSDKIQSSIQTYGVSDKLKSVPKNVWETALSLRYLTITSQSQDQHKDQSEKAKKYLIEELKDEKLVEELLITSEKIIVDQSVKKGKENAVSTIKSSTTTEKAKEITELGSEEKIKELLEKTDTVVVDHAAKKVIKEKADQSVIQEIQETVTEEEITKVIEIQNKEGSYEKYLTKLPKNLDREKFPIRKKKKKESSPWFNLLPNWGSSDTTKQTTIKKIESIPVAPTTSTTKSPEKPKESVVSKLAEKFSDTSNTGSLSTFDNIATSVVKLSKDIEDAITWDEKDDDDHDHEKVDALDTVKTSSTTKEVIQYVVSKQNDDGSIEAGETVCKQLDAPPKETIVTIVQQYITNEKLKNTKPIWITTAVNIAYLKNLADQHEDASSKYVVKQSTQEVIKDKKKAAVLAIRSSTPKKPKIQESREYLSSQIGDKQLEEDIIKASSKVVIDKSSEKVAEASKKEALKEIQITPEITKIIVSTQKTDGSFEVSKEITDKLNSTSPESLVTSVITYTKNDKLKNIQPSVWQTVISMQYLKNTASQYENDWTTVKEKEERTLQKNDGSITLHKSIKNQFNVSSTNRLITNVKSYISNQHLRSYDDSVFETALTIYILRYVLVEHKGETQAAYERANSWLSKQLNNNKELEKELFSACEQYVIEEGSRKIEHVIVKEIEKVVSKQFKGELEELDSACDQYLIEKAVEAYNNQTINVQITKLDVDETTKTTIYNIYNGLRSDAKVDHALSLCKSQHNNGSFTLHKIISEQLKISSSEEAVETLKSYVGSLRLRRLDKSLWISAFIVTYFKIVLFEYESEWPCEQYLIQQSCEFLNSKNTTIVTEVLHKPSQSVIYGSDDRAVTQKGYYLNSELIVTGAAARAKSTDLALKYTEDEINRLFDNNVTHGNKDNVLNRAKRATKFLMDEYYKSDNNYSNDTFNEEDLKEAYRHNCFSC